MNISKRQKDLVKKLIETVTDINEEAIHDEEFCTFRDNLYNFEFLQDVNITMAIVANLYRKK